jgi:predicted RNA-binding Zn ribbon-like protein
VSAELVVRDGDGKLVYRFHLPCDPIEDADYLAALMAGDQVHAIACERPGHARVFYAKTRDELRKWADRVRRGEP